MSPTIALTSGSALFASSTLKYFLFASSGLGGAMTVSFRNDECDATPTRDGSRNRCRDGTLGDRGSAPSGRGARDGAWRSKHASLDIKIIEPSTIPRKSDRPTSVRIARLDGLPAARTRSARALRRSLRAGAC